MHALNATLALAITIAGIIEPRTTPTGRDCCRAIKPPSKNLYVGRPSDGRIVWPFAPDIPRIRYDGLLRGEVDLGKKDGFFKRMKVSLAGLTPNHTNVERPYDVYADATTRRVYVSDGGVNKVTVYDSRLKSARALGKDGPGRLVKPMGIGGDLRGRVYVADQAAKRVVVFGLNEEFIRAIGDASVLLNPVDVAVDAARNRVYVVDAYQHQVLVFDTLGELRTRIGQRGGDIARKRKQLQANVATHGGENADPAAAAHGWKYTPEPRDLTENRGGDDAEFRYPAFIAVAPDGTLYVTDSMNFRVQAFDASGKFLRAFGGLGDNGGSFARPKGLAVDTEGHIYVADGAFNNLQIFNAKGKLLLAFAAIGHGEGQLWMPTGISIDQENKVYVADRYNHRIQIYQFLGSDDDAAAPSR